MPRLENVDLAGCEACGGAALMIYFSVLYLIFPLARPIQR
jgi:hypothetical protein